MSARQSLYPDVCDGGVIRVTVPPVVQTSPCAAEPLGESIITAITNDPRFSAFVTLWNRGSFFAAHEALEALWLETDGEDRDLLQGLIQLAVALEHQNRGNPRGAVKVFASARARLISYGERVNGIAIGELQRRVQDYLARATEERPVFPSGDGIRQETGKKSRDDR